LSTDRTQRIIRIIIALQSAQNYSVEDLARLFETSRRTIYRDLNVLQKAGVPFHYAPQSHCYTIDKGFSLPISDLSTMETLGLLLLLHKISDQIDLPFKKSALWAALKIENGISSKVKNFCSRALEHITIKDYPQTKTASLDKFFVLLIEAILKKRIAKISYQLSHIHKPATFDLRPYHLLYNKHGWNILGKSDIHDSVRSFRINRIKELYLSDKCFVEDEEFDIKECLGRAWSMLPEGKLYHIKLKFSPKVATDVAEVQWHSTQRISLEEDGYAIIEFRVDGLSEIKWWILGYGDQVQVLAPMILQQKIIKISRNMAKLHKQLHPI